MTDANDILRRGGPDGLRKAIETAEACDIVQMKLELGSDQEVAECVARDLKVKFNQVVFSEGDVYVWATTHWVKLTEREFHVFLKRYDGCEYRTDSGKDARYKLTDTKRKSVMKLLELALSEPEFFAYASIGVACATGFISINEHGEPELVPHNPDQRQRHFIDVAWVNEKFGPIPAESLLWRLCEGCFGEDTEYSLKVDLMGELIGAALFALSTRIPSPKTIILLGETAANGKSQWLALKRSLLPKHAVSSVAPSEMDNQQRRAQLSGVWLNTADELGHEAITSDKFKAVVSGDRVSGKVVYREPFEFNPEALHVFATNVLPTFKDGMDRGVRRRLQVLTFARRIPSSERIVDIGRKTATNEAELLLAFAVDGACRLMKQRHFTRTHSGQRRLSEWIVESDLIAAFFEDEDVVEITGQKSDRYNAKDVYRVFRAWAQDVGVSDSRVPTQSQFTRRAKAHQIDGLSISRTGKSGNHFYGIKLPPPRSQDRRGRR